MRRPRPTSTPLVLLTCCVDWGWEVVERCRRWSEEWRQRGEVSGEGGRQLGHHEAVGRWRQLAGNAPARGGKAPFEPAAFPAAQGPPGVRTCDQEGAWAPGMLAGGNFAELPTGTRGYPSMLQPPRLCVHVAG